MGSGSIYIARSVSKMRTSFQPRRGLRSVVTAKTLVLSPTNEWLDRRFFVDLLDRGLSAFLLLLKQV